MRLRSRLRARRWRVARNPQPRAAFEIPPPAILLLGWMLLSGAGPARAQGPARLVIQPGILTQCTEDGLGRASIAWTSGGPGLVQVRVGSATGEPLTGLEAPSGSAETGDWVSDGMVFVLVDAAGNELARNIARVACNPARDPLLAALAASSYFPLQAGNQWVFRVNSRIATSTYEVWRIARAEQINGRAWFVLLRSGADKQNSFTSQSRFRDDELGRVYLLTDNGQEELWLDPTTIRNPAAALRTQARGVRFSSALGSFDDALSYSYTPSSLVMETGYYVRGVGPVASRAEMLSGSSGGFLQSYDLVYARLGGHIVFATPADSLQAGVEAATLDVTGRAVTNCAVPCYFVACALSPGTDPPDTYKPCFQAHARLEGAASALEFDLLDGSDQVLFHAAAAPPADAAALVYQQIPLYSTPNHALAPGAYRVRVTAQPVEGGDATTAVVPVTVK